MKVVIPMSGQGVRFKEKGYFEPKPLITVSGKPMIQHVVNMFPSESDFIFICNKKHIENTEMLKIISRIAPKGLVIEIEEHKKGPLHAVMSAFPFLDEKEEVIISYCDYAMTFNYHDMIKKVRYGNYAGAVPAYTGFHPHLLRPGLYGGILRSKDGDMVDYKEKYSFTEDLMESYHSAGMYYFKNAQELKNYARELSESELSIKGEKYISMIFYYYLRDNKKIYVPKVDIFMQWGTPEDLEDYIIWQNFFFFLYKKNQPFSSIPEKRLKKMNLGKLKEVKDFKQIKKYWNKYYTKKRIHNML